MGALKAIGAQDMGLTEDELPPLVDAWRQSNPNIVKFWWDVDRAVMEAVKFKHTTSQYGPAEAVCFLSLSHQEENWHM
mgnify:CR=1 FL=1